MQLADDNAPLRLALTELRRPGAEPRWLTELDERTAIVYARLVRRHAGLIEASLGSGVIANRVGPRGTLRPLAASRSAWRRRLTHAMRARAGVAVVSGDVSRCYASIRPGALRLALAGCGVVPGAADELLHLLARIARAGTPGLPVGPEPSAVLANAVLATADRAATQAGAELYRWVDDVVLIGPDRSTVMRSFDAWTHGLRAVGLRPNDAKTRIWGSGDEAVAALRLGRPSGA
jgi:hypothetical protein